MDISQVSPELRGPLKKLPKQDLSRGWVRGLAQAVLGLMPASKTDGVRVKVVRDVGAGLRLYMPEVRRSKGALLWIHGGGYVIGRAIQDDRFCAETARELGIPVVSVEYRKAPKHRFPAPLDDCHAAWEWLQASAPELDVDPARVAIGGQSAGGGLAAGLVQRVHDGPGRPAVAQWLLSPMLDDRTAADRGRDAVGHFVWDNASNAFGWRALLGVEPGAAELPAYASPARRESLEGLPPAWIGVGDIDLFLDEERAYAERLRAAGVPVAFQTVPAAPHGFESWAAKTPLAERFVADARRWLGEVLR